MMVLEIILLVLTLALFIPIALFFLECSAALLPRQHETENTEKTRPSIAVLIPAHNEESGIRATLETLLPELIEKDRAVVIADNCTDETASIARNLGATVIERQDSHKRGKGYALDYGLQFLAEAPPEVVVIIDADCFVHPMMIESIARLAKTSGKPVQGTNLLAPPSNPNPKDGVSSLAFMVKNLVRPQGLSKLGFPCLLSTGVAFPWSVIRRVSLASGNIVEDMQLGIDLAIAGYPALFCSEAKVTGVLPKQEQAAKTQRTRWEHGHLRTLLTQVPKLLQESLRQRRFDLLAIALDLCVPPLSLLVIIWAITIGAALLMGMLAESWTIAMILGLQGLLLIISIIGAWAKFGRADLPAKTLLAIPFYILWKIPIYLAFLVRPQTKWIRTERDTVENSH